jgi:hypothetical protein
MLIRFSNSACRGVTAFFGSDGLEGSESMIAPGFESYAYCGRFFPQGNGQLETISEIVGILCAIVATHQKGAGSSPTRNHEAFRYKFAWRKRIMPLPDGLSGSFGVFSLERSSK